MFSTETLSLSLVLIAIISYFARIYFPYPPVTVIGVDLGTSFSAAAYFNNGFGNVSLIFDKFNKSSFPSIVTVYQNGTIVVGEFPNLSDSENSEAHVIFFDSKRYIGRNLTQSDLLNYPFKTEIVDKSPRFLLPNHFNLSEHFFTPQNISTLILGHIKENFKLKFGYYPSKVVIGVPVEFSESQREATKIAAEEIGLSVLRLVNEPTAASMAADVHNRPEVENVAVIDLGGGTYDVAILSSIDRALNTLAIAGNDKLGGRDFTHTFGQCLLKKYDLNNNFEGLEFENFVRIIEEAKIKLSEYEFHEISFKKDNIFHNFSTSRVEFEDCCYHLFKKLIKPIEAALSEARLEIKDIQEIVLVGGATKMLKLRSILADFFQRQPNLSIDPDSAVVIGLANQAGILTDGGPLEKMAIDVPPKNLKKIRVD